MDVPSPSVFAAARGRQLEATNAWTPGVITIGGTDYEATVRMFAERFELSEQGPKKVQRFSALLSKADLPAGVSQGDIVKIGTRAFKVSEVSGHNEHDVNWRMDGLRTPGSDS